MNGGWSVVGLAVVGLIVHPVGSGLIAICGPVVIDSQFCLILKGTLAAKSARSPGGIASRNVLMV